MNPDQIAALLGGPQALHQLEEAARLQAEVDAARGAAVSTLPERGRPIPVGAWANSVRARAIEVVEMREQLAVAESGLTEALRAGNDAGASYDQLRAVLELGGLSITREGIRKRIKSSQ